MKNWNNWNNWNKIRDKFGERVVPGKLLKRE
jgi:hypothetical protein